MTDVPAASPIQTVLAAVRAHGVRALLMGGQACVLYGAAEFSRDTDLALAADPANLARLGRALRALDATVTAVPPFTAHVLGQGHAVHFRCAAAEGTRLDVMAHMRNVAPFDACWARRTTFDLPDVGPVDVLALPDLVACKKTRRDKDWPMVRRLVDADYADPSREPTAERVRFWLRELRTPVLLVDCVRRAPDMASVVGAERPAVAAALGDDDLEERLAAIGAALAAEEARERAADEAYWRPLLAEQEAMRRAWRRGELSLGWPPGGA